MIKIRILKAQKPCRSGRQGLPLKGEAATSRHFLHHFLLKSRSV